VANSLNISDEMKRWRRALIPSARGRRRSRVLRRSGWRDRLAFGAEVGNQLSHLFVRKGLSKWRHLLSAIQNLIRNLVGWPSLVFGQSDEGGCLLTSDSAHPVAIGATFVAKEKGARLFIILFGSEKRCGAGPNQNYGE